MRIVTWNCNMALHQKFDRLLSLRPDVAVVQECARPGAGETGWQPPCRDHVWTGFNPHKGLGVFSFGDFELAQHPSFSERFALWLPVTVNGPYRFKLLGVWTAGKRSLPAGSTNDPLAALAHYADFLSSGPVIVAGDFNLMPQQMSHRRPGSPGRSVADALSGAGLDNADYTISDAVGRPALRRTLYHTRKRSRGFVVDYIYVSSSEAARLTAFEVGEPRDWTPWSDHMPVVLELEPD